jgi:hypothetical protein
MKYSKFPVIAALLLGACATTKPKLAEFPHQSTLIQIENTIRSVKHQIEHLQSLEEEIYSKSAKGDPRLKLEFKKMEGQIGNLESLEAALKMLSELRNDLEKIKVESERNT